MKIKRKKVCPWTIHPDIELSAFGACAVLRALGYKSARGKNLLKLSSAPSRQGHFTKFYRMCDIKAWAGRVSDQAKAMRSNGYLGNSEPYTIPETAARMDFPRYEW